MARTIRAEGGRPCHLTAIVPTKTCTTNCSPACAAMLHAASPVRSRAVTHRHGEYCPCAGAGRHLVRCGIPDCQRRLELLNDAGERNPAPGTMTAALPPAVRRPRSGAESYVAGLKAKLSIGPDQLEAWRAFADALSANGRRMRSDCDCGDEPFGSLPDRLDRPGIDEAARQSDYSVSCTPPSSAWPPRRCRYAACRDLKDSFDLHQPLDRHRPN